MALLSSHHHIKHELFDYSFSLINKEKRFMSFPFDASRNYLGIVAEFNCKLSNCLLRN